MTKRSRSLLCLLVLLAGCASSRPSQSEIRVSEELVRSETRFRREYVWAAGDQLEVFVRQAPEVSRTVVVRPDGYISLPLIDDVPAAGLTPMELKDTLTARFARRLLEPEVSVIAVQVPPPVAYVMGEVTNGISVPLRNASTAAEAIAMAGGFRPSADPEDVVIIRLGEDGYIRAIRTDVSVGGQPGRAMALRAMILQPDDIVYVPENGSSQLARFLDQLVARPIQTITGIVGLYVNFRLIELIAERD